MVGGSCDVSERVRSEEAIVCVKEFVFEFRGAPVQWESPKGAEGNGIPPTSLVGDRAESVQLPAREGGAPSIRSGTSWSFAAKTTAAVPYGTDGAKSPSRITCLCDWGVRSREDDVPRTRRVRPLCVEPMRRRRLKPSSVTGVKTSRESLAVVPVTGVYGAEKTSFEGIAVISEAEEKTSRERIAVVPVIGVYGAEKTSFERIAVISVKMTSFERIAVVPVAGAERMMFEAEIDVLYTGTHVVLF
ncbi:hypothetical protein Hamer_G001600 [Homarus americanus]|uniref:Uncharacterized protein n=1 Tax=Homarus americanus TaxID=6706 RepID=A0A8J5JRG4_HOMAM|nr:hypothetical protein Hamer_G001600 [Homarus americanus]